MKIEILNTGIVVIAQQHNPTILHPSFLKAQNIVPDDWQANEKEIICTPAFAMAKYENGILFSVEGNKFQVVDNNPPSDFLKSQIPELANKYVSALPHVHYTSVGVNITGVAECDNPEAFLIQRFLKRGSWNEEGLRLQAFAWRFVYEVSNGVLHLGCDPGKAKRTGDSTEIKGLVVNANYHTGLTTRDTLEQTRQAIGLFSQRCEHFKETMQHILDLES